MISYDELVKRFHYDPKTGEFTRKLRSGKKPEKKVGTISTDGYAEARIDNKRYFLHRLAWLYMTGEWPRHQIDHINRDKLDNRWANLREASGRQNGWNKPKMPNNTSGFKGVTFHKQTGKWQAQINYFGRNKYLGIFTKKNDAKQAYEAEAKSLHGEFYCE